MAKRTFEMNGNTYGSMMDIARELGIKRIYPRDFAKYGIVETTSKAVHTVASDVDEDTKASDVDEDTKASDVDEDTKAEDDVKVIKEEDKTVSVGSTTDVDKEDSQLVKKTIKKVSSAKTVKDKQKTTGLEAYASELKAKTLDELVELAKKENLETYENVKNSKIRRMRLTMALKDKKYPGQKLATKRASFKRVPLDTLKEFAKEVGVVDYTVTSEERTQKMWLIHALNKAGYYDIPEKKEGESA